VYRVPNKTPFTYILLLMGAGLNKLALLSGSLPGQNTMAKDYARPFYNSHAWESCRRSYIAERIQIDGGLCEACHQRIGFIVHHKTMITESNINDANVTLNHSNLQFVCKQCHDRFDDHFVRKSKGANIRYMFDDFGQPYIPVSQEKS